MKLRTALIGLFSIIAVAGGFLIIDYVRKNRKEKKKKDKSKEEEVLDNLDEGVDEDIQNDPAYEPTSDYPISLGSYNPAVKILQLGLIEVYGQGASPKVLQNYGADSQWGAETQAALIAKAWKTSYASLAEINAQIKAKKPASQVSDTINETIQTDINKYYLLGAEKYGIFQQGAYISSKTLGKFETGNTLGIVKASVYDAKKSNEYIPCTLIIKVFGVYGSYSGYIYKGLTYIKKTLKNITSPSQFNTPDNVTGVKKF